MSIKIVPIIGLGGFTCSSSHGELVDSSAMMVVVDTSFDYQPEPELVDAIGNTSKNLVVLIARYEEDVSTSKYWIVTDIHEIKVGAKYSPTFELSLLADKEKEKLIYFFNSRLNDKTGEIEWRKPLRRRIEAAIAATKKVFPKGLYAPNYWDMTVAQRLDTPGSCGSVVSGVNTPEQLENLINSVEWEEYPHPAVMEGCSAFKAYIPGRLGIVNLASLSGEIEVVLDDRKNTGMVSAVVNGTKGDTVGFTVIILGNEGGEEIVFTIHPGEPVIPSKVQAKPGMHGKKITVVEALKMGLTTAKII